MNKPLMKCGHSANAINNKTGQPCCAICDPPLAYEVEENPPDLANRVARCFYYGKKLEVLVNAAQ